MNDARRIKHFRDMSSLSSFCVLVLLSFIICFAEGSILPPQMCRFMDICDFSEALTPTISHIENRLDALRDSKWDAFEAQDRLAERIELLEDQLGMPYYRRTVDTLEYMPEITPESFAADPLVHETPNTKFLRKIGYFPSNLPLIVRVNKIEKWKEEIEEDVTNLLGKNEDLSNIWEKLEQQALMIKDMERMMDALRTEMNGKLLQKEEQLKQLQGEIEVERGKNFGQLLQIQELASTKRSLNDVLAKVASLNDSAELRIKEVVDDVKESVHLVEAVGEDLDRIEDRQRLLLYKFEERIAKIEKLCNDTTQESTQKLANFTIPLENTQKSIESKLQTITQEIESIQSGFTKLNETFSDHVLTAEVVEINIIGRLNQFEDKINTTNNALRVVRRDIVLDRAHMTKNILDRINNTIGKEIGNQMTRIHYLQDRAELMEKNIKGNFSLLNRIHQDFQNISRQVFSLEKRSKVWDSYREELRYAIEKIRKEFSDSDHGFRSDAPDSENKELTADISMEPQTLIMKPKDKLTSPFSTSCNIDTNILENLIANLNGRPVENTTINHGKEVVFRCRDIGTFRFHGSPRRKCEAGTWTGIEPWCEPLLSIQKATSNLFGISTNATPSIVIGTDSKNAGITPSGDLIVPPRSKVNFACIFPRVLGTLQWKMNNGNRDRYMVGRWSSEHSDLRSGRPVQPYKYEINLSSAQLQHSGLYTCITSHGKSHSIRLTVKDIHCPYPLFREMVRPIGNISTTVNSIIYFACSSSQLRLDWINGMKGDSSIRCLSSGVWSRDFPTCSKVL